MDGRINKLIDVGKDINENQQEKYLFFLNVVEVLDINRRKNVVYYFIYCFEIIIRQIINIKVER